MFFHNAIHLLALVDGHGKSFFERHPIASSAAIVIIAGALVSGGFLLGSRKR